MWMIKHKDNFDHFFKHYNPWNIHTGGSIKIHKKHTPAVCINDSETAETGSHRHFATWLQQKNKQKTINNVRWLFWLELCLKRVGKGGNPGWEDGRDAVKGTLKGCSTRRWCFLDCSLIDWCETSVAGLLTETCLIFTTWDWEARLDREQQNNLTGSTHLRSVWDEFFVAISSKIMRWLHVNVAVDQWWCLSGSPWSTVHISRTEVAGWEHRQRGKIC